MGKAVPGAAQPRTESRDRLPLVSSSDLERKTFKETQIPLEGTEGATMRPSATFILCLLPTFNVGTFDLSLRGFFRVETKGDCALAMKGEGWLKA